MYDSLFFPSPLRAVLSCLLWLAVINSLIFLRAGRYGPSLECFVATGTYNDKFLVVGSLVGREIFSTIYRLFHSIFKLASESIFTTTCQHQISAGTSHWWSRGFFSTSSRAIKYPDRGEHSSSLTDLPQQLYFFVALLLWRCILKDVRVGNICCLFTSNLRASVKAVDATIVSTSKGLEVKTFPFQRGSAPWTCRAAAGAL